MKEGGGGLAVLTIHNKYGRKTYSFSEPYAPTAITILSHCESIVIAV